MIQSENETDDDRETGNDESFSESGITRLTGAEADPIGAELKRIYDDAATEPLPQELLDLLSRLEELERADAARERRE